jgi:hypothetical protein
MGLTTRLDRLEAAMRGRDPPDDSWICRRLIYMGMRERRSNFPHAD